MPQFNFNASDPGLSQDFQAGLNVIQNDPLNTVVKDLTEAPAAYQQAKNRQELKNRVDPSGGYTPYSAMDAVMFQHLKDTGAMNQPISEELYRSKPVQDLNIPRQKNGDTPLLKDVQDAWQLSRYDKTKPSTNFDPAGTPINGPDGKLIGVADGKGGIKLLPKNAAGAAQNQKALQDTAAAFKAIDQGIDLGNQFLPDSYWGGLAKSPVEALQGHMNPQSAENKYRDQMMQAATQAAVAEGGRMSEEKVKASFAALGGSGIGETKGSIAEKGDRYKNTLALRAGVTRQDVEDYMTAIASKGGSVQQSTPVGAWQNDPRAVALMNQVKAGQMTPAMAKMKYRIATQGK